METWGVVFLGIIALSSLVQGVFLVALLVFGRRAARRLDSVHTRIDREITPALENLSRATRSAAEIADIGALQARRLDLLLADTADKVEHTTSAIEHFVTRPLKPLGGVMALVRGVQKGIEVFFGDDGAERAPRPSPRRAKGAPGDDDEHLFI
jgi:hypothetical protein